MKPTQPLTLAVLITTTLLPLLGPWDGSSEMSFCSQVVIKFDTMSTAEPILKLRGTRDSISDGRYYLGENGAQRDSTVSPRPPFDVYGQVFSVRSLSGNVREETGDAKKVVLIWWSVTPACTRDKPYKTIQQADSDIVIALAPRERAKWINGIPTFDVPGNAWVYVNGHDRSTR